MSHERLVSLYLFLIASGLVSLFWWLSTLPDDSRASRGIARVLESWFLSTRWSAEPRARLRSMAILGVVLALMMLYLFIVDPPLH